MISILIVTILSIVGYYLLYGVLKLKPTYGVLGCGLYGFNGNNNVDQAKIRYLAELNQARGNDSTGYYTIKGDKARTRTLFKKALSASTMNEMWSESLDEVLRGATQVVGHTRAATKGIVNEVNAHPFEYNFKEHVVGAHNGFIIPQLLDRQTKEYGFEKEFDVDSQLIFAALSKVGDIKILPKIEGAVTVAFVMPDKYPGVTFLYKRKSRVLHWARTKEGVYYSSESGPLKKIGCRDPHEVPDDSIMLLKNGDVYDLMQMESPHIKLGFNSQRLSWNSALTPSDYEAVLPELAKEEREKPSSSNYHQNWHNRNYQGGGRNNFQSSSTSNVRSGGAKQLSLGGEYDGELERYDAIVKDIAEEISRITGEKAGLTPVRTRNYELDDLSSAIVLVRLRTDKGDDLPGWVVIDEKDQSISGITGPNGVTAFKYPMSQGGSQHKLQLYDPILEKTCYTVNVTPFSGSVLEVTLEIPFRQKQSTGPEDTQTLSEIAELHSLSKLARNSKVSGVSTTWAIRKYERDNNCVLQEGSEQVQTRSEEAPSNGGQEETSSEGTVVRQLAPSTVGDTLRQFSDLVTPVDIRKLQAITIIQKNKGDEGLLRAFETFKVTQEYHHTFTWVQTCAGSHVKVMELLKDSHILRWGAGTAHRGAHSLLMYVFYLLSNFKQHYSLKEITEDVEHRIVGAFALLMPKAVKDPSKKSLASIIFPEWVTD